MYFADAESACEELNNPPTKDHQWTNGLIVTLNDILYLSSYVSSSEEIWKYDFAIGSLVSTSTEGAWFICVYISCGIWKAFCHWRNRDAWCPVVICFSLSRHYGFDMNSEGPGVFWLLLRCAQSGENAGIKEDTYWQACCDESYSSAWRLYNPISCRITFFFIVKLTWTATSARFSICPCLNACYANFAQWVKVLMSFYPHLFTLSCPFICTCNPIMQFCTTNLVK